MLQEGVVRHCETPLFLSNFINLIRFILFLFIILSLIFFLVVIIIAVVGLIVGVYLSVRKRRNAAGKGGAPLRDNRTFEQMNDNEAF
jgi:predicted membrane protein